MTSQDRERVVFRAGVGMVVMDESGRVLALERADVPGAWQLPQGGLKLGEEPEEAAWRELEEETGLTHEHVKLRDHWNVWIGYELPEQMRSPKTGRGQVHVWFLFHLRKEAEAPRLPTDDDREFSNHRWITFAELLAQAVSFRQPSYELLGRWLDESP